MILVRITKIIMARLVIYLIDLRDKEANLSQIQMQMEDLVYFAVATTDSVIPKEAS